LSFAGKLEEAVASERKKWLSEERRAWEGRRDGLLLTAHKQWSLAQEPLLRAEVEKAKKEGAELATKEHMVSCGREELRWGSHL
jgi:hypothetical protein